MKVRITHHAKNSLTTNFDCQVCPLCQTGFTGRNRAVEDVAALVFGKSKQKDTFVPDQSQSFSFITHIPEDMEDDGIDKIENKEASEEEDIAGILEGTEGENIWSSMFQSS